MTFHCTQCGLCCEKMDKVLSARHPQPWMQALVDSFPYGVKANGHCEQYEHGLCMVYDERPLLCDIERIADEVDTGFTRAEWLEMNYQGCRKLQSKIPMRMVA